MNQNNPWLSLWTKPRNTIRNIIETDPIKNTVLLSVINGLLAAFTWTTTFWIRYPQEKGFTHPLFILLIIVLGIVGGLINLYVGAFLFRLTGSWIGGKGTYTEVKCSVGWSNYPYIVSGIVGFISVLLYNHPLAQAPFLFLKVAIFIWSFIIFLKILAEAHRFSAWKALLCSILSFVIVFLIIMVIAFIFTYLTSHTQPQNSKAVKIYDFSMFQYFNRENFKR